MKLTPSQEKAIEGQRDGHLQLIACAGSGKTEVVAQRIASLLDPARKPAFKPENIVAFTFTEKAAAELKQRIVDRVRERLGEVVGLADLYVGTIHAFCLDLLKSEVHEYLKYEVLNEVQQAVLVDRHSKESGLTTTTDNRGTRLRRYVDTDVYVRALGVLREAQVNRRPLRGTSLAEGLEKYQALLKKRRYLDYSEILARAASVLEEDGELRERLGERIKHVIVDEYQDVNPVQERLIRQLESLGARVCVVGDDDQTIYQWRGSDVGNILTFQQRYKPVAQIRLQENFRSSRGVVETARDFIQQNSGRLPKEMIPTQAQAYEKGDITALHFDDPDQEAAHIVETIRDVHGTAFTDPDGTRRGLAYADMAILLRSVSKNGGPITAALEAAGIPFIVSGMNQLFDTREARAARDLFYFLASAEDVDAPALREAWVDTGIHFETERLRAAIKEANKARIKLASGAAGTQGEYWSVYNLQRQFLGFLETAGLLEERIEEARREVVLYNLGKFSQLISDFESVNFKSAPQDKYESFAGFLRYRAASAYPEGWQDVQYANPDAVRVMTVHQAKGMQWPVVFLPALLRNRFPSPRMGGKTEWHLIPDGVVEDPDRYRGSTEDERRLFYVALTRSQKFLFLSWAPIAGKNNRYARPSEFFEDVLVSKYVKRTRQDYTKRLRLKPQIRTSVANVSLSFSELKYFFECPYQFKLRILYGFNPPIDEALGYGKSLHDALAEVHGRAIRGDVPDPAEAEALVERHLHVPYAYPELERQLRESAERVVGQYLEDRHDDFDKLEFAEKWIELNLGDGVRVGGRIDLVRRTDTNETSIVDLKSTKRAQPEDVTETQLHIYALGYLQLTGRDADYVEIYNLDEGKAKPRAVDEDLILQVQENVKGAAAALRRNALPAKPSKRSCPHCDYVRMCSRGQAFAP